ncbi:MAG: alpha/beta hydrolase [Burkholderiaceae bacterium]
MSNGASPGLDMPLAAQLQQFSSRQVLARGALVSYRESCSRGYSGPATHVLLHGIGSASASWLAQLAQCAQSGAPASRILAWDAPGYGESEALPAQTPAAGDYAQRIWDWLEATGAVEQPFTLVGHSLGALMAARAALLRPARIARLILLAPAQGYARAEAAVREKKLSDRLASLAEFGPAGMARRRARAMLSEQASAAQIAFVEHVMAAIRPDGYTQAAHMLSGGDLRHDLEQVVCARTIASGSADTVTPPEGCQALAQALAIPYVSLGPVGHSCALEAGAAVNQLLGISGDNS